MRNRTSVIAAWVFVGACRGEAELPAPLIDGCAACAIDRVETGIATAPSPCASAGLCGEQASDCIGAGVVYPMGTHSPVTCAVGERWRQLVETHPSGPTSSFIKVGDSISASHEFLHCFATEDVDLEQQGYGSLSPAHQYFQQSTKEGVSPYTRVSQAARASMTAAWALDGDPSPAALEVEEMTPSYALVMFGTNDLQYAGEDAPADVKYAWMLEHMRALVDWHIERGVLPMLYSIPPYRGQYQQLRQLIPGYNDLLRALAGSRLVPFVDYYTSMTALPNEGLRADGVHPSADYIRLCRFDEEGLQLGYNLRNLLTLEALDRVWRVTRPDQLTVQLEQEDGSSPGARSVEELMNMPEYDLPLAVVIPLRLFPRGDLEDTCGEAMPHTARWRLPFSVSAETPARVVAVGLDGATVRLRAEHHAAKACLEDTDLIESTWAPGTTEVVFEAGGPISSEVALLITPCFENDPRCAP